MKYIIEDTHDGYRFTMQTPRGRKYEYVGGDHSAIEQLFAHADSLWASLRASGLRPGNADAAPPSGDNRVTNAVVQAGNAWPAPPQSPDAPATAANKPTGTSRTRPGYAQDCP